MVVKEPKNEKDEKARMILIDGGIIRSRLFVRPRAYIGSAEPWLQQRPLRAARRQDRRQGQRTA